LEVPLIRFLSASVLILLVALVPGAASAQTTAATPASIGVPPSLAASPQQAPAAGTQQAIADAVKKWHIGMEGGIALDPELINIGAFGELGPVFSNSVTFRPGLYFSFGELTTEFGVDLDFTYTIAGSGDPNAFHPYIGGGFNFALSHQGFEAPPSEDNSGDSGSSGSSGTSGTSSTSSTSGDSSTSQDRFDFSDTSFDTGLNFIAGARRQKMFFELKATAYGVANVRLLVGFRF
jgi:hypothetical protein